MSTKNLGTIAFALPVRRFAAVLLLLTAIQSPFWGADFKDDGGPPQGYDHDKYAPHPEATDHIREFAAFCSAFDGDDDDTGDGIPDIMGVPEYVSYEMRSYPGDVPSYSRPSDWITEDDLHTEGVMPNDGTYGFDQDYRDSNPDDPRLRFYRGHLCMKSHAARINREADWNTHTLYNAVPQDKDMNNGIWKNLENLTADWADKYGAVWIIVGPIFYDEQTDDDWQGEAGEVPAAIPDALFKVVVKEKDVGIDVLAFVYPNQDIDKVDGEWDHLSYAVTVDFIEDATGLNMFPDLSVEEQQQVESVVAAGLWPE